MKLSVVTPSLNQARYLAETLDSVRTAAANAPGHEIEHIVRDGGSTDGSVEILRAQTFAKWESKRDGGQAEAINAGLNEADGEVLSYLCSDDLWQPQAVRLVIEAFEKHPDVDVVYGDYFFLEGDSGWRRRKVAGPFSVERLRKTNFPSQPATFWRRRVHERFGGLDPGLHYCLDREYWLRIAPETKWLYLPEPLAVMRLHGDSKTCSRLAPMWWESARMSKRYELGVKPWIDALRMQIYGQYFYALKRRMFEAMGRKRSGAA
jgi:glycosyltransferase involved in cell wall biosynthesis